MPHGGKVDRAHSAIARNLTGKNKSGRAWAIMQSRGMVKRRGRHMVATRKLTGRKSTRR